MDITLTQEEFEAMLKQASVEGARTAIKEMKKQNMFKSGMDAYQKTEYLLKNYNEIKAAIRERDEQIREIERFGTRKKSSSVTTYPGGTRSSVKDDYEKADEQIDMLRKQNEKTNMLLNRLDTILAEMTDEPYFDVIPMLYMDGKKYEVIAGELGVSTYTVSNTRKKLLNRIKIKLFVDDVIDEIMS